MLLVFAAPESAGAWSVLGILLGIDDLLDILLGIDNALAVCGAAPQSAGAWSVLGILLGIDDLLGVCGASECWRAERRRNSARDRRPSRCLWRLRATWSVTGILIRMSGNGKY